MKKSICLKILICCIFLFLMTFSFSCSNDKNKETTLYQTDLVVWSTDYQEGVDLLFSYGEEVDYSKLKLIKTDSSDNTQIPITQDMISGLNTKRPIFDEPIEAFVHYHQQFYRFTYKISSKVETDEYTLKLNNNQTITLINDNTIENDQNIYVFKETIENLKEPLNKWPITKVSFSASLIKPNIETLFLSKAIQEIDIEGFHNVKSIIQNHADGSLQYLENQYLVDKSNRLLLIKEKSEKTIILPPDISKISEYAFNNYLEIESFSIYEEMEYINLAKLGLNNLNKIDIISPLEEGEHKYFIENNALYFRSLKKNNKNQILVMMFKLENEVEEVIIEENTTTINAYAFNQISSIRKLVLTNQLALIEDYAFNKSQFEEITFLGLKPSFSSAESILFQTYTKQINVLAEYFASFLEAFPKLNIVQLLN